MNYSVSNSSTKTEVTPGDPGFIYVVQDGTRLKVGRTINPKRRMRDMSTWIPKAKIIGVKPFWNHKRKENILHIGLAHFWDEKEWYEFGIDPFLEYFISEFMAFSDTDINTNSINFTYMINGTGMSDFTVDQSERRIPKKGILKKIPKIF